MKDDIVKSLADAVNPTGTALGEYDLGLPILSVSEVQQTVNNRVAEVISGAPSAFDTLKEIADWITTHGAAQVVSDVTNAEGKNGQVHVVKTPASGGTAVTADYVVYQASADSFVTSATGWISDIGGHAGDWDEAYNTVTSTSGNWDAASSAVTANSGNWDAAANAVTANSGDWNNAYVMAGALTAASANWESTFSTVFNNSGTWDNTCQSYSSNSGDWVAATNAVMGLSATWDAAYSTVDSNSGNWDDAHYAVEVIKTASSRWDNAKDWVGFNGTNVLNHISATDVHVTTAQKTAWNTASDAVTATSANWNAAFNHVSDTDVHVTTAQKAEWDAKQDALSFGNGFDVADESVPNVVTLVTKADGGLAVNGDGLYVSANYVKNATLNGATITPTNGTLALGNLALADHTHDTTEVSGASGKTIAELAQTALNKLPGDNNVNKMKETLSAFFTGLLGA